MSVSSEGSTVPGLTTPHLKGEEIVKENESDSVEKPSEGNSVFELASTFQEKLNQLVTLVDQHDTDLNGRIDKLVKRINDIEKGASSH